MRTGWDAGHRVGRVTGDEVYGGSPRVRAALEERGIGCVPCPDTELDDFVDRLAKRIAGFTPGGIRAAKRAINDLTPADPAHVRSDAATFQGLIALPETRERLDYLADRGLQKPGELEHDLGKAVAEFRHCRP